MMMTRLYNGTLAILEFQVMDNALGGEYPINISYYKGRDGNYKDGIDVNYNAEFEPLSISFQNGKISVSDGKDETPEPTVKSMSVKAGTGNCAIGETVDIPLILGGNTGFANLGIEIEYDAEVLSLTNVTASTGIGAILTRAQSVETNPYNMVWDSTSDVQYEGTLAILTFRVLDNAAVGTYPITVSYYKGREGTYTDGEDVNYNENFEPLNISYISGSIQAFDSAAFDKSIRISDLDTKDGTTLKASLLSDTAIEGVVITAVYSENDTLLAVKSDDAESEINIRLDGINGAEKIKVFWWNNTADMIPQALSETAFL